MYAHKFIYIFTSLPYFAASLFKLVDLSTTFVLSTSLPLILSALSFCQTILCQKNWALPQSVPPTSMTSLRSSASMHPLELKSVWRENCGSCVMFVRVLFCGVFGYFFFLSFIFPFVDILFLASWSEITIININHLHWFRVQRISESSAIFSKANLLFAEKTVVNL
jgi:hypothetical protein